MNTTYSIEEIVQAQETAKRLKLTGWKRFCAIDPITLAKVCNGVGPEWLGKLPRDLLTWRFGRLAVAAMLHDVAYEYGTGTDEDFKNANIDLKENGYLIAKDKFAWYDPRRYLVMRDAGRIAAVCQAFGRKAYDEAIAAHKARG